VFFASTKSRITNIKCPIFPTSHSYLHNTGPNAAACCGSLTIPRSARDDESRYFFTRTRSGAVECGLHRASVRPDDGRYGENPTLPIALPVSGYFKTDPGNRRNFILTRSRPSASTAQHDIRFVEDNWAQPASRPGDSVGRCGSTVRRSRSSLTFSRWRRNPRPGGSGDHVRPRAHPDRLAQRQGAWDLPWNDTITYGEVRQQEEREHSKYYFEVADVTRMREVFDNFEREANACLDRAWCCPRTIMSQMLAYIQHPRYAWRHRCDRTPGIFPADA